MRVDIATDTGVGVQVPGATQLALALIYDEVVEVEILFEPGRERDTGHSAADNDGSGFVLWHIVARLRAGEVSLVSNRSVHIALLIYILDKSLALPMTQAYIQVPWSPMRTYSRRVYVDPFLQLPTIRYEYR